MSSLASTHRSLNMVCPSDREDIAFLGEHESTIRLAGYRSCDAKSNKPATAVLILLHYGNNVGDGLVAVLCIVLCRMVLRFLRSLCVPPNGSLFSPPSLPALQCPSPHKWYHCMNNTTILYLE
jgi:hypothetical protein